MKETFTAELSRAAYVLLAERASRRGLPPHTYATLIMEQALLFGDRDELGELVALHDRLEELKEFLSSSPSFLSTASAEEVLHILKVQVEDIAATLSRCLPVSLESIKFARNYSQYLLPYDAIELQPLLKMVILVSEQSHHKKMTHTLVWHVADGVPEIFAGEAEKIQQILHNLIGNALKYSPNGGNITVSVAMQDTETLLFSITDQGIGMSSEFLPNFGKPFAKPSPEESCSLSGSGIGVCLSKSFVEFHRGNLWAHSDGLGKGSTVCFTLPVDSTVVSDTEFTNTVHELRRWKIKLSALLAEIETLPRIKHRVDGIARADLTHLIQAELEQMQTFLNGLMTSQSLRREKP